jgi:AcrR family transcriptional regulator
MSPVLKDKNVREDLLDASIKLFAHNGFDGTSIRDIIKDANATLSSVTYYFGGKENLYLETIRYAMNEKIKIEDIFLEFANAELKTDQQTSDQLAILVRKMALAFLDTESPNWYGELFARAMLDSTHGSIDVFLERHLAMEKFEDRLLETISEKIEFKPEVFTTTMFGQIQFMALAKPLILKSRNMEDYTRDYIEGAIHQITRNLIIPLGLPEPDFA